MVVLRALPAVALQVAVTLGVLGTLLARRVTHARTCPAWSAGLAAGALTTTTSTNGPPMLLHLLGRGATPEQVRDTLTVVLHRARRDRRARAVRDRRPASCPDAAARRSALRARRARRAPGRAARVLPLAAGERYERVLTAVMLVAVLVGLIGALLDR